MKKSAKIIKSYQLTKISNYPNYVDNYMPIDYYNYQVQNNPAYLTMPTRNDAALQVGTDAAFGGMALRSGYRNAQALTPGIRPTVGNVLRQSAQSYAGAAPLDAAGKATKITGLGKNILSKALPAFTFVNAGLSGYQVYNNAANMNRSFQQSAFAGQPGGSAAYALGTTEGRNRLMDTVQGGSLTLAGTALGAGIGSIAGGIGALPGAAIGGTIGGLAELGIGGYRKATGWDSAKFDAAKKMYKGDVTSDQAVGLVVDALENPNKQMFESEGIFGKRDLGQEALADVKKEEEFKKMKESAKTIKNESNAFQQNIG